MLLTIVGAAFPHAIPEPLLATIVLLTIGVDSFSELMIAMPPPIAVAAFAAITLFRIRGALIPPSGSSARFRSVAKIPPPPITAPSVAAFARFSWIQLPSITGRAISADSEIQTPIPPPRP